MSTKVIKTKVKDLKIVEMTKDAESNLESKEKVKITRKKSKSVANEDFNSIESIINRQFDNIDMSNDRVKKISFPKVILDQEPETVLDFKKQDKIYSFIQKNQNIEDDTIKEISSGEEVNQEKAIDIKHIFKSNKNLSFSKYKNKIFVAIALISVIAISLYFYTQVINKKELDPLQKISLLAIMPSDEVPKVYKILENAEILKNPLFKGIIVGDTVFIYEKNKQIYFFRESKNKIVSIVQIN